MTDRRIIQVYYNADTNQLVNSANQAISSTAWPFCYLGEYPVLLLTVVRGPTSAPFTAFTDWPADMSFGCVVDNDFVHSDSPLVQSFMAADFNQSGDWASASIVGGKLAIRLNANTVDLETALGESESIGDAQFELTCTKEIVIDSTPTAVPVGIIRFPFVLRNTMFRSADPPPEIIAASGNYYTKTEEDAFHVARVHYAEDWLLGASYVGQYWVTHDDGYSYIALGPHTAATANEPGSGPDWETYWARINTGGVGISQVITATQALTAKPMLIRYFVSGASAPVVLTLPPLTAGQSQEIIFHCTNAANAVSLASVTINGVTGTVPFAANRTLYLYTEGTAWHAFNLGSINIG